VRGGDVHQQRKLLRLPGYDYTGSGYYFVTICALRKQEYFGNISDSEMVLNEFGQIVQEVWNEMPHHFSEVTLDAFVVMPNHVHGIIVIHESDNGRMTLRNIAGPNMKIQM
jgi:REP element-mobilizing transposase RayT